MKIKLSRRAEGAAWAIVVAIIYLVAMFMCTAGEGVN